MDEFKHAKDNLIKIYAAIPRDEMKEWVSLTSILEYGIWHASNEEEMRNTYSILNALSDPELETGEFLQRFDLSYFMAEGEA